MLLRVLCFETSCGHLKQQSFLLAWGISSENTSCSSINYMLSMYPWCWAIYFYDESTFVREHVLAWAHLKSLLAVDLASDRSPFSVLFKIVASEIFRGLEQWMRRNFAEFSSETKFRNLFALISFALYCRGRPSKQFLTKLGAPNENIVENHLSIALLNVF